MNSAQNSISSVIRSMFRAQDFLAQESVRRFRSLTSDYAPKLNFALLNAALAGAHKGGARNAVLDDLREWASERALTTLREINATSKEWLAEGREPFSTDRVVMISVTEASNAHNVGFGLALKHRGKRFKWVLDGKPCKACRKLAGRVRKPGQEFAKGILNPPAHPHCQCSLVVVNTKALLLSRD